MYSAKSNDCRSTRDLYYYARKGIIIKKDAREIEIFSLCCNGFNPDLGQLKITVRCSKGTYIRVLGADIGKKLGCGAHLIALRRLGSGTFSVNDSLSGEKLSTSQSPDTLLAGMISVEEVQGLLAEDKPPEAMAAATAVRCE